ncbi:ABC transporter permease [Puteibacter caeruleilacunae]|nr:ABC transporter permease [Puteibacter caeruleilacunae]
MFKNYLLVAIRYIFRNKTISSINILGLAISLASGILILSFVKSEITYDKFWKDSKNIYRITLDQYQNGSLQFKSARNFRGIAESAKQEIPEVIESTTLGKDIITIYTPQEQIQDVNMFWTDSCFFNVFNHSLVHGDINDPFPDVHAAMISEKLAFALFGTTNAVDKRFKLNEGWEFYVSGVFNNPPVSSHFHPDVLIPFSSLIYYMRNFDYTTSELTRQHPKANVLPALSDRLFWNLNHNYNPYVYIKTVPQSNTSTLETKIAATVEKYTTHFNDQQISCKYHLQPIADIHLNSNLKQEIEVSGNKLMVIALAITAIIILLLAWINFINLTLAQAIDRLKETSIRKVLGAQRKEIIHQFLIESILVNSISAVLAFVFVVAIGLIITHFAESRFNISLNAEFFSLYLTVVLLGVIVSSIAPALFMAMLKPVHLFKKQVKVFSQRINMKQSLVIFQFAATIVLIISTITIYNQIRFMQNQDLGVEISQTLVSYSPMSMLHKPNQASKLESFRSALSDIPGVHCFTTSSSIPGKEIPLKSEQVKRKDYDTKSHHSFSLINADSRFYHTYNLNLSAGRYFTDNINSEKNTVIINQKACKFLGYLNPNEAIDQYVSIDQTYYQIVGVVKNHHQESLRKDFEPILFRYNYQWYLSVGYYSIKILSPQPRHTIARIEKAWKKIYPNDKFQYQILEDSYNKQYSSDIILGKIFAIFSLLAIIIASLGLLGLSIFSVKNRIKEIGIRKVNGAKIIEVMTLLNRSFIIWIGIAFLFACPIAYYAMDNWLSKFAFRIDLTWWYFALSGVLALVLALLTASWYSWQAAIKNPVDALRYE